MRIAATLLLAFGLSLVAVTAIAQESRPYTEGPVTRVAYIRTKPGHQLDYLRFLDGTYKKELEAAKKEGLITGFAVFRNEPRSPSEPDIILTVTYPNMAALDRTDEFRTLTNKVHGGTEAQENKEFMDRGEIREVLGSQLIRELVLK